MLSTSSVGVYALKSVPSSDDSTTSLVVSRNLSTAVRLASRTVAAIIETASKAAKMQHKPCHKPFLRELKKFLPEFIFFLLLIHLFMRRSKLPPLCGAV